MANPKCGLQVLVVITLCAFVVSLGGAVAQSVASPGQFFIIRQSERPPEQVVEAIRAHIVAKNYIDFGTTRARPPQGEIVYVKFCMPTVGRQLYAIGLELSAMLPCGNVSVYSRDGRTEIVALHPNYMNVLFPHPAVERASAEALPLITELLDSATR